MNILHGEKLVDFFTDASSFCERTVTLIGLKNQRFSNYRINGATVVVTRAWYSRVEPDLWDGTTLTKPSHAYSTGNTHCVRFEGTEVCSGEERSFIWFGSGHGLPVSEVEILAVAL